MMSLITPTNGDAAVIIGNRRCDHVFVIIAPVLCLSFIFVILFQVHILYIVVDLIITELAYVMVIVKAQPNP